MPIGAREGLSAAWRGTAKSPQSTGVIVDVQRQCAAALYPPSERLARISLSLIRCVPPEIPEIVSSCESGFARQTRSPEGHNRKDRIKKKGGPEEPPL
jgi:hypothetical protein